MLLAPFGTCYRTCLVREEGARGISELIKLKQSSVEVWGGRAGLGGLNTFSEARPYLAQQILLVARVSGLLAPF